jgi:diguanylate cyclase (GGDEF)-like protein
MTHSPGGSEPTRPLATHCWLEVPDLDSVDHDTPGQLLLIGPESDRNQAITQALAGQGHHLARAPDWGQALKQLELHPKLELIICDQAAPDPLGLGLNHYLNEPHLINSLPVIVVCQSPDLSPVMDFLASGAVDFLNSPYNPQELLVRVKKSLIQYRTMILYLRAAHRDPLTGLYNKRVFSEMLPREISRARRDGVPLGLLFADLDHFKRVNDSHGHLTGDQVLKAFAQRLCMWVREGDMVARYGGEEFVVVAPGAGRKGVRILAERIRQAMERPVVTRSGNFTVTVSLGAAVYGGEGDMLPDELLNLADQALYQAKEQGRNRVVVSGPDI